MEEKQDYLQTIVALLIALVTVIGAVAAWRASVAADAAGDADFAGLRAVVNVEETRARNYVNAYENYGAFTAYKRYGDLGALIAADLEKASPEEGAVLNSLRAEANDLAVANQSLFPNRFLNRDGTYALQRQMGEMYADAAKEKNLNPEPQLEEADKLREKTNFLLTTVALLGIALVFLTVTEATGKRASYVMLALGLLFMLAGTAAALWVEFRM